MISVLHLTEAHEHTHEPLEHEHAHENDYGHHTHAHDPMPAGPHTHWHRHQNVTHAHPHVPDAHHRHDHGYRLADSWFCHKWLARAYGRLMYFTSATMASTTSTTIRIPTTIPPPIIQPMPSMRII